MSLFGVRLRVSVLFSLAMVLMSGRMAFAVQATLVADAHVNKALPAVNSGAISNLNVGGGFTSLLQFDLSTLPAGTTSAQISKAVLRVYCNRVDTAGLVSLQPVSGSWAEYGVTFATLPTLGAATQVISVTQAGAYLAVDVTALVQGWIAAPAKNFGIALTAATAAVQFDSKENDLTGHSAELEVVLVSQGPQGVAGTAGSVGPQGVAGVAGLAGTAAAKGDKGDTGATGATGPVGATGLTGPAGSAGAGVGGVLGSYQGVYSSVSNYAAGDVVVFQGSSYTSLSGANHGNTPGLTPGLWGVVAVGAAGPIGPQGIQGLVGPLGLTGSAGVAGPTGVGVAGPVGPQGAPGLVYQGAYASGTNYALGDVVLWQGASYSSLVAGNHGNTPSFSPAQWGVLTAQGPTGATGLQGSTGFAGPQGLPGSVGPNGETGPQGIQGIAGQAGARGLTGPTGVDGLSGPMGPQGVAGPVGLAFQGAYVSGTNYALADGVSYHGAGYVSLVASNHGNTPDLSPAQWALFAAAGGAGAIGPAGSTGAAGVIGGTGPQGSTGVQGPPGATGSQGPPVANYLGAYVSGTNYALNDAVGYGGSTYISLAAGNHGNTPGLSPIQWAVLVERGADGVAGPSGVAGAAGPAGVAGASGVAGAAGPPASFAGGWLIGSAYSTGEVVGYGGSSYVALITNTGRQPDLSPVYWAVLAQAGGVGPAGATGAQGLQGPTGFAGPAGATGGAGPSGVTGSTGLVGEVGPVGPAGVAGPVGAAGIAGLSYRGAYASGVNYGLNDGVTYLGSTYISLAGSNAGNVPGGSPSFWSLLAAQGGVGAAGSAGATGPAGSAGSTGAAGVAGAVGAAGPAGVVYRGAWDAAIGYSIGEAALFGGTTYLATANAAGLQPDLYPAAWGVLAQRGGAGATGPTGVAASVTVGTVTTGLAGTQAIVTNSGTAAAAVLNFTLPQGAAGLNGSGGGGVSAAGFLSMYHSVSFNFVYYSVNSSNASASEGVSILTWVPAACTATSLTVFSQQTNAVTVTLRQGTPGAMANTALACVATSGVSCSVTASVPVAAGSFVDLSVTGASGTAAGVWTAVGCS
jgi:hypothetical protein